MICSRCNRTYLGRNLLQSPSKRTRDNAVVFSKNIVAAFRTDTQLTETTINSSNINKNNKFKDTTINADKHIIL
jgi:hypothetical protein